MWGEGKGRRVGALCARAQDTHTELVSSETLSPYIYQSLEEPELGFLLDFRNINQGRAPKIGVFLEAGLL
jgi:hypothetical protein